MDSDAVLHAIEANLESSEPSISQSSMVRSLHNLSKSIQKYQIVLHITTILQNFWLILVLWWNIPEAKKN